MGPVAAIVQARLGSTRMPRKVLADIHGRQMLSIVLDKAAQVVGKDNVILATPYQDALELLDYWPNIIGAAYQDVLSRFWRVATLRPEIQTFVRFTADCPLLDVDFSRSVIARHSAAITTTSSKLDGLDTEVFTRDALRLANDFANWRQREHVTMWMKDNLRCNTIDMPNFGPTRWSVDDQSGLDFVRRVYGLCACCRAGVAHHTNASGSIGGSDRSLVVDLHVSEGGGLEECLAADVLKERIGPEWAYRSLI